VAAVRSSYPATSARVFFDALERLNFCMEPLLVQAGIGRADLDDPDARIPCAVWDPMEWTVSLLKCAERWRRA
jgi:hypothetical protein